MNAEEVLSAMVAAGLPNSSVDDAGEAFMCSVAVAGKKLGVKIDKSQLTNEKAVQDVCALLRELAGMKS